MENCSQQPRTTYLVTYSQADRDKVSNRTDFAKILVDEFDHYGRFQRVVQWACCKEDHEITGFHYHLALKLTGVFRWKQIKTNILAKHGFSVHFRTFTTGYYDAYTYVIKEDRGFVVSEGHPVNLQPPNTNNAMRSRGSENLDSTDSASAEPAPKKAKRMTPTDLYDIVINNNIKTDIELCRLASEEREKGNIELANFVIGKDEKRRNSLISTSWKMKTASSVLEREAKSRMELLREAKEKDCIAGCGGRWLEQAAQTLSLNNISKVEFAANILDLLEKGRGKKRNILLVGNSNCGKTFLLKPVTKIFQTFQTPATSTFNWVGAEKAECVFLNDFRWSERLIPWSDFLNLLEGEPIHVPAPKTHFAQDALWTADTPIFATSKSKIRKYERGQIDEIETEMMDSRWKVYVLKHQFSRENTVDIAACPKCFAEMVLATE